jgi:hypothetical protein
MLLTWSFDKIGASQKEHGWRPSSAHIIFPQVKQFGAVSNSGCIEALHVHFLLSFDTDGFVESSRAAMAAVRSATCEVAVVETAFCGDAAPDCGCECEE